MKQTPRVAAAALAAGGLLFAAACGSSGGGNSGSASANNSGSSSASNSASNSTPDVSANGLDKNFAAMKSLSGLAAKGKGGIGVLLPDTTTSARYVEFDAPLLTKSFEAAGLKKGTDFSVQNAQGNNQTQISQAQADLSNGDSVLIVDPLTTQVGAQIEKLGKSKGAAVIDYDRLTLGGSRSYYISFDNVKVGKLIGLGFAACVKQEKVNPVNFIEMKGDPTDNNATLFAQGYDSVIKNNPSWHKVAEPAGTWDPPTALQEFQQALTANSNANAAIIPNDENAAPIISYLKNKGIKPNTFPITGQDATSVGLQNILLGYQCGTVYKPIYLEAQGAAAVALYVRAGQKPPADLVNGKTEDTQENTSVPSVLLTPEWVTSQNMQNTVVSDGAVPAKQICTTSALKSACQKAGVH